MPGILYHSRARPRQTQRWLNSFPGTEPAWVCAIPYTGPSSQQCPGAVWGLPPIPGVASGASNHVNVPQPFSAALSWKLSPTACWHCGTDDNVHKARLRKQARPWALCQLKPWPQSSTLSKGDTASSLASSLFSKYSDNQTQRNYIVLPSLRIAHEEQLLMKKAKASNSII